MEASRVQIGVVALAAVMAALAVVAGYLLPRWSSVEWDTAWTAASGAATAGMLLARRASTGRQRRRFTLWAAAAGSWLGGQLLWNLYGIIGFPQSPNLADVAWWGFAAVVIASLIVSDARSRSARIVVLAETLPAIGAAVALSVAMLWRDASVSTLSASGTISALVYPSIYIAAAVVTVQAIIGGALRGYRRSVAGLVTGGMAAEAIAFGLWSPQLLAQTYVPGHTLIDPLFVLGLVMIAAGGTLAARRPESAPEVTEPARTGGIVPGLLFVLLLTALVHSHLSGAPAAVGIVLSAGLLFSGTAFIARGGLLERRLRELLERERAARAALAEREAELARLNAQLVEDSRRDPLTGMRNRRALSDDLLELQARRHEPGRNFAVALCDVDHFKAYNDRLGHLAGDHALRTISAIIRATLRAGDLAYRFGGEELLLVLRGAHGDEAVAVAERVRAAVEAAAVPHPDGVNGMLTASIGVAAGDDDVDRMLARADGALYEAKRAGRNRTVLAADSVPDLTVLRPHEPVEEPVPRHLRSMLAVSRAAAAGQGPLPVLEALAETIRSELSFHVVAVNILDEASQEMRIVTVLGDDDARRTLLGTSSPWSVWAPIMTPEFERRRAIWLPAGSHWGDEMVTWTPSISAVLGPDGWHPDDTLLLPLRGQDERILGAVSVDQPASGRRPDDEQITYLMSVVDHAALGLEQNLRAAGQAGGADEQSSELRLAAAMLLAEALDLRDPSTGRHSRTVGDYARQIAERLGLGPDHVERIHAAGVLHDLGKLGIADAILYKPGPLSDAEWEEMRRHPEIGARILLHAGLTEISHWVRAHHERIDGHGYPDRLSADEIPLEAQILAVADAYEAMIADRPYRSGMAPEEARTELGLCSGTQFDPVVVEAFLETLAGVGTLGLDPAAVDDPGLAADRGGSGRGEMDDRVGHLVGLQ
jgi:diguanylate cyclase (GGDEF)-like protein